MPGDYDCIRARILWTMENLSAELRLPLSRVADAVTHLAEQRFHGKAAAVDEMLAEVRLGGMIVPR